MNFANYQGIMDPPADIR